MSYHGSVAENSMLSKSLQVIYTCIRTQWKLFAALGIEDSHGHSENMVRIGAGYELPVESTKVTPVLAVDFVGGETIYVLSVSLGFSF